jgi:formylglycine-generating enzyme required for sulfatase activity/tRNA A-37 threonylcarbamoyl transferase component Bud32
MSNQPTPPPASIPPPSEPGGSSSTDLSGRELTMLPPVVGAGQSSQVDAAQPLGGLDGRELTLQTPATGGIRLSELDGRELTLQTPAAGLDGREMTLQTPVTGISGRELTMQTPATGLDGREMTLQTPATGLDGREMTLQTPATGIDGRELTLQSGATPTPATVGGKPRTDHSMAGFKPRTGVGTSIAFDDAWHLQGRKGPHTGQSWGDFEMGGILGEGGMGAVYRAKQKSLKRRVAIKVLPPNLAQDIRLLQRFQLEASTTSKLQTPHVVQVYAVGEHEGNHFYAMEYIEGKDLYDIIKERREQQKPLTPDECLGYILQAAKGLAEAGRHQIVHRDIKPPNMMVTKDGLLKIADFGIVKVLGEHNLTMTGQAVGTPAYVSPEQGRGDREVDCRSDLYSLGVVFYELVCDKKPFDGSTPNALIYQHCYEEPKLPKELNAAVSDEIQAVIMRCLQKKAENRYQSADELVRDLEAIKAGSMLKSAIANYKLGTGADEAKREQMTWLQRNMLPVAAAALLVIGLGVGGYIWYEGKQQAKRDTEKEAAFKAERDAREKELIGKQKLLDERKGIAEILAAVAPLPEGIAARVEAYAKLLPDNSGSSDGDVRTWRAKLAAVAELNAKLAPLDSGLPTPAARDQGRKDLEALQAKVGATDTTVVRITARLNELDTEEAALRTRCAGLDTAVLKTGTHKQYRELTQDLARYAPADDEQMAKWTRKLDKFDADLKPLLEKIAPLDADTQITVSDRATYQPVVNELAAFLDEGDTRLDAWRTKLGGAQARIDGRRRELETAFGIAPDRISKPKQDQMGDKLREFAELVGDDGQLKDWQRAIAAANTAIEGSRERLARWLEESGDGVLSEPLHAPFRRDLDQLKDLNEQDPNRLDWEQKLAASMAYLDGLRKDCAVLDVSNNAEVTLAAQKDLAPKIDKLVAKGAVDPGRAAAWRERLVYEAKRVADLRTALREGFGAVAPITSAMVEGLKRLTLDAGLDDADVRTWTAKKTRVEGLAEQLSALDNARGVPDNVVQLFADMEALVGDKEPRLVSWRGKVKLIGSAREALRILDRRTHFNAGEIARNMQTLVELVGKDDRQYVAWKTKADEVARLKADLAQLPTTLAQSPEAHAASHQRIVRLVSALIGPDDDEVKAAAARQQQLDGPPQPSWAVTEGRDRFGRWAEAEAAGVRFRLRWLPPATATLGSPEDEAHRDADELRVAMRLPRGFWISETEVTRALWRAVVGADPSRAQATDIGQLPVERMTWAAASDFCARLREAGRLPARLPLEAEWELAARAGSDGPYWLPQDVIADASGVGQVAWSSDNAGRGPQPVATRLPNALGLYDLLGNVSEWTADAYAPYPTGGGEVTQPVAGSERMAVRGGSWGDPWHYNRNANRIPVRPLVTSAYVGLRLAADAQWGGAEDGGAAIIAAAARGAGGKGFEFGIGTWRVRVAQEAGK